MARLSLFATALVLACAVHAQDKLKPDYYTDDWTGTCASGKKQSPINIVPGSTKPLPAELVSNFAMPIAEGVVAKTAGNVAQVRRTQAVKRPLLCLGRI